MEQRTRKKQSVLFKVLCVILAILLMIGIAFIVAKIVHKTGGATVEHGLSAYELAEKYGYEGSLQERGGTERSGHDPLGFLFH